ncbi:YjgN family protein [Leptothrix sp. BB-4]
MTQTLEAGSDASAASAASAASVDSRTGWTPPQPVTFTGSGSEYFRIWIVNLLLMLVTAGIYYPWAKARRLRYFHANTRIGDHAFSFHGEGRSMLRGFAVMGALLLLVSLSGQFSLGLGLLAAWLLIVAAPLLLRLSMQFRLSQTGWRGLRFSFHGTTGAAAWAASAFLAIGFYVLAAPTLQEALKSEPSRWVTFLTFGLGIAMLCLMPFLPMAHRALLAYRQGNIRYAGASSSFCASVGAFYRPILLCIPVVIVFGLLAVLLVRSTREPWLVVPLTAMYSIVSLSIWRASIQNAVWTGTRMPQVELRSTLGIGKLAGRYALNCLGLIVTLGLYWPFAAVATARLRLGAVSVSFGPDFERGIADPVAAVGNAGGDAAADLTGFDLGL